MAETPPKRQREEPHDESSSEFDDSGSNSSKRQKPYNNILNLLDEEEEEPEPSHEPSHELSQDHLSAIFTTLQQELSSSTDDSTTSFDFESAAVAELSHLPTTTTAAECGGGDQDESAKSVMRHLLEASDDELGIPNTRSNDDHENINVVEGLNSGENFPFEFNENGLWEIEDEAANYYTVLQSELFM